MGNAMRNEMQNQVANGFTNARRARSRLLRGAALALLLGVALLALGCP
jgi:hypothetical protein